MSYTVRKGLAPLTFPRIASRTQASDLPVATRNARLPFSSLDPEVFERVVAELIYRQNNAGAYFYGRRGQKQHGLDIVEFNHDDSRTLYQVKRYKNITPAGIKKAVTDFTGPPRAAGHSLPPRPYAPKRFVVVTSAEIAEDTKKTDAIRELKEAYRNDVEIEVWGAEILSPRIQDAPSLTYTIFGPAWAEILCGYTPSPRKPRAPSALGLIDSPIDVLNLTSLQADAEAKKSTAPLESALIFGRLADELDAADFPGHASEMRQDQARAARQAGDFNLAFSILFDLSLTRLIDGHYETYHSLHLDLSVAANQCEERERKKVELLDCVAAWPGGGSNLKISLPALKHLADANDHDTAVLCCLILEGCVVDGLYDFIRPDSLVASSENNTSTDLTLLRDLASGLNPANMAMRARIRCAVADASLGLESSEEDVDRAYHSVLDDALGVRFQQASGLVSARAAYAYAIRGFFTRSTNLWRNSVRTSSEHENYGDVREALVSSWRVEVDSGRIASGFTATARALPNRDRLIGGNRSAALFTLSETQRAKWRAAFIDARRWIWESRLGGHLHDEYAATKTFGDILAEVGELQEAILAHVRAGSSTKAAKFAGSSEQRSDVDRWINSPVRRRRAAAIQVIQAQVNLVPDSDVASTAEKLMRAAQDVWTAPRIQPTPELDAIRALSAFGVRLPDSITGAVIALAAPAVEQRTGASTEIFELLLNLYWACEQSRTTLAPHIKAILDHSDPYDRLWGWVIGLPRGTHEPILADVENFAASGNEYALLALSKWQEDSAPVQLFTRRAVATLLRKNLAQPNDYKLVDPNGPQTAELLCSLFECSTLEEFSGRDLSIDEASPVSGVGFQAVPDIALQGQQDHGSADASPDARPLLIATGTPEALANAVVRYLTSTAENTNISSTYRVRALDGIRRLVPRLVSDLNLEISERLRLVHIRPAFSRQDLAEMASEHPLSGGQVKGSAPYMPAIALLTSAEALASTIRSTLDQHQNLIAESLMIAAIKLLRDSRPRNRRYGARTIATLAAKHEDLTKYSYALFAHEDAEVRAAGASETTDQAVLATLAKDPSFKVRASVAARSHTIPEPVRQLLEQDSNFAVRLALTRPSTPAVVCDLPAWRSLDVGRPPRIIVGCVDFR